MISKNEIGNGHHPINFNELSMYRNHQSKDILNDFPVKSMQSHQMMKFLPIKVEHDFGFEYSRVM